MGKSFFVLTVPHVSPARRRMSGIPGVAETAVAPVKTKLRYKSVKSLSYLVPGERNKGTNRSGGAEIELQPLLRNLHMWVEVEPR